MTKNSPPKQLSPKAKTLWKALTAEYDFESEAAALLVVALENLDLADAARELLRREGLVVNGKKHPASDACKLHDGLFMRGMRQLALDVIRPGGA